MKKRIEAAAARDARQTVRARRTGGKSEAEIGLAQSAALSSRIGASKTAKGQIAALKKRNIVKARKRFRAAAKARNIRKEELRLEGVATEKAKEENTRNLERAKATDKAAIVRQKARKQATTTREALVMKAEKSGIDVMILAEVWKRGMRAYTEGYTKLTREQYAFSRVNSFISGGKATELDADLVEAKKFKGSDPVDDMTKSIVSDAYKEAYGSRPRSAAFWNSIKTMKDAHKILGDISKEIGRQFKDEKKDVAIQKKRHFGRKGETSMGRAFKKARGVKEGDDLIENDDAAQKKKHAEHAAQYKSFKKKFERAKDPRLRKSYRIHMDHHRERANAIFNSNPKLHSKPAFKEGAGDDGTDRLRKKYAADTPGQNPEHSEMFKGYVEKSEIAEPIAQAIKRERAKINELSAGVLPQTPPEPSQLLTKIKSAVLRSTAKKSFERAAREYLDLLRDNKGKSSHIHIAGKAAQKFQKMTGHELMRFVDDKIRKGLLPKHVGSPAVGGK
tara:strand:+ start:109 stop:1623 length:1515 start_codon:yes stop_codon:yes gene_type:complete